MYAVVEAPHARYAVSRHHVLAVGTYAHRTHPASVPLERAHLRTFGKRTRARAVSSAEQNAELREIEWAYRWQLVKGHWHVERSGAKKVSHGLESERRRL
eukprot:6186896-Pleurochrysis_carterae.AAC.2